MKNADKMLDDVLRGLGDVQPSSGLEDRVLADVRARTLSPAPWHASLRQRALLAFPLWGFTAAGLAMLSIASALYVRQHVSPSSSPQMSRMSQTSQTSPVPQPTSTATLGVPEAPATPAPASHGPTWRAKKASAHTQQASAPVHLSAVPCDCDSLAMQEWRAPSQPAPELPLTHEERLLQGFAYRGNTEELATLTPAFRAAENAREQAEFQQFFKKPTNGDNE